MSLNCSELLERILQAYRSSFDIRLCEQSEAPLVAAAAYHEHATGYMMVKKAEMWAADRHEYDYFFSVPHLTEELFRQCLDKTMELGEPLVKPGKNHMCTNLVLVILCDSADDAAIQALKKCRIRKSFHFSLHGWMEVQTAAVELGKDSAVSNPAGRPVAKFLKNVLHPTMKRKIFKTK